MARALGLQCKYKHLVPSKDENKINKIGIDRVQDKHTVPSDNIWMLCRIIKSKTRDDDDLRSTAHV